MHLPRCQAGCDETDISTITYQHRRPPAVIGADGDL